MNSAPGPTPAPGQWGNGSGWLHGPLQGRRQVTAREPQPHPQDQGRPQIHQPAGDTHTLQGTSLRVTRTSSSEPVSRWVPLMVSVVPPACGPCFGSTLRGWGCYKSDRCIRVSVGAVETRLCVNCCQSSAPPRVSTSPRRSRGQQQQPHPTHVCPRLQDPRRSRGQTLPGR